MRWLWRSWLSSVIHVDSLSLERFVAFGLVEFWVGMGARPLSGIGSSGFGFGR